ncbi:hypothetical protein [Zooshikella sp. RANM57]|uniref:hypothetical protein n=1 Tax=Zooshikella sp. RANM57 TaxID=3425863 RepID=UPI003D6F4264
MTDWKKKFMDETVEEFGYMPAPWVYQPNCHPYSIGWRMGRGESYMMYIFDWLSSQSWSTRETAEYFIKQNPPAAWLLWIYEVLFPVEESDYDKPEEDRIESYRQKLEDLGFKNISNFSEDFNSNKWQ